MFDGETKAMRTAPRVILDPRVFFNDSTTSRLLPVYVGLCNNSTCTCDFVDAFELHVHASLVRVSGQSRWRSD